MKVSILSSRAITPQSTFDSANYLLPWIDHKHNDLSLIEPEYQKIFPSKMLRRMSGIMKMSVVSGITALQDAGITLPESIIVGTGLGCIGDTEIFLTDIAQNSENLLSPTPFIQSTHNTLAGQLALLLNCPYDNITYSNRGHSFENAVQDAVLKIKEGASSVLVGGVDERAPFADRIINKLHGERNCGWGEGVCFFVLSNRPDSKSVVLNDIQIYTQPDTSEISGIVEKFLNRNNVKNEDIDGIILGGSPDNDDYYHRSLDTFSGEIPVFNFKIVTGEYFTSVAYAYDLALHMIREQTSYPKLLVHGNAGKPIRHLLVYNHFKGVNHSLTLISS